MDISTVGKKIDDIEVKINYRIIELFSAGLYSSPNKAFEELICNSYDAFADNVSVFVPSDLAATGAYIWVCDNGEGLDAQELKDLWRIGKSSKRDVPARDSRRLQIGQFGIGKLATYILARKLTYLTKKEGRYLLATMDYALIVEDNEHLTIDEREITETEAIQLIDLYIPDKELQSFELFGSKASNTWTLSLMTDLKPKATDLKDGRLRWILRTALPLSPGFNLLFNGSKIESSKLNIPVRKEWILGHNDITAESVGATCREIATDDPDAPVYAVDFENLKGVTGTITLYVDSLLTGKASNLGRSHGIFLNIRGRLINLDDPLLGMEAFSHGVFNRTRIVINADELDNNLTSTREAVKESLPYTQLKEYIKKKFNNEVRRFYFEQEQEEEDRKTVSYRLSRTAYTTSKKPIYNFISRFFDGKIINPFLIERPLESEKKELLEQYKKDLETGEQIVESVQLKPLSAGAPIAQLNLKSKILSINLMHPFIANNLDSYKNQVPLETFAITEVLTEAHLYELDIDEVMINNILHRRDSTFRQLALSDNAGIPAVAMQLKDCLADPTGLEEAMTAAFNALGFEAITISGNGKPDGKADARLGYNKDQQQQNYSFTYDAKSTSKDAIAAGTAKLSTLKRHQQDYDADYSLEVAIAYQGQNDPESAISKEARDQRVTVMQAEDLVKILFLAAPKRIDLFKFRDLLETCHTPLEVKAWIDRVEKENFDTPPYNEIIDIIYQLQDTENEMVTTYAVKFQLNADLGTNFTSDEIGKIVAHLHSLVPGHVSIEGNYIGISCKPETLKGFLAQEINNGLPVEWRTIYREMFQ